MSETGSRTTGAGRRALRRCSLLSLLAGLLAASQAPGSSSSPMQPAAAPAASEAQGAGRGREGKEIHLNGYRFDPIQGLPDLPAGLRYERLPRGSRQVYIVQLHQSLTPRLRRALQAMGVDLLESVPHRAFLGRAGTAAIERVKGMPETRWVGLYEPAYKVGRSLETGYDAVVNRARQHRARSDPSYEYRPVDTRNRILVRIAVDPSADLAEVAGVVRDTGGARIETSRAVWGLVGADVPRGALEKLARDPRVLWLERQPEYHPATDVVSWIVQSADRVSLAAPLYEHGVSGRNQIVTVADSGIHLAHSAFYDPAVPQPGLQHRKVRGLYTPTGVPPSGTPLTDESGHGTLVAGIIAGDAGAWHYPDGDRMLSPDDSSERAQIHDGIAFDASLSIQDFRYQILDISNLFQDAVSRASWIHSNSWVSEFLGVYGLDCALADDFVFRNPDMSILGGAGNDGDVGPGNISAIATAKNVIGVGATENGSNFESVATFSSRGPADDGRVKPDLVAPGRRVYAPSRSSSFYLGVSGTSFSTPVAAGGAALIRQYFADGYYPTGVSTPANGFTPSAALIRAALLNSTREISGAEAYDHGESRYPNVNQGWGSPVLDEALFFTGDLLRLRVDDNRTGVGTGERVLYTIGVSRGQESLEMTLAWSDFRGFPSSGNGIRSLVNDLDLKVTAPDGTIYLGNQLEGFNPGRSRPNPPAADRLNNLEVVLLPEGVLEGVWTVEVIGWDVPAVQVDRQPYALVMTGGIATGFGAVRFDKPSYDPHGATQGGIAWARLLLEDANLDVSPTARDSVVVEVSSDTETQPELIEMLESADSGGVFRGAIVLDPSGSPSPDDLRLQVKEGDTITVRYLDVDDGLGGAAYRTAQARVDDRAPILSAVRVESPVHNRATILWTSDEPATSHVFYGVSADLEAPLAGSGDFVTQHQVTLLGLTPSTRYYFAVMSYDRVGNSTLARNGSVPYQFTTPPAPPPDIVAAAGEWPMLQNNRHRHGATAGAPAPPLVGQWVRSGLNLPIRNSNGVVFAGGRLWVATADGFLRAFNPYSGTELWELEVGDAGSSSLPSYADGIIYVLFGDESALSAHAVDVEARTVLWSRGPTSGLNFKPAYEKESYPPVSCLAARDGRVFGTTREGAVAALSAADGSTLWLTPVPDGASGCPTLADGLVLTGTGLGGAALSEADGRLLWSSDLNATAMGPPLFAGGIVYFAVTDTDEMGGVVALQAHTGAPVWGRLDLGGSEQSGLAFDGASLFVASSAGLDSVYRALDPATGATRWERSGLGGSAGPGSLVRSGAYLYGTGVAPATIRVFDAATGSIVQEVGTKAIPSSHLAAGDGWLWTQGAYDDLRGYASAADPDLDRDGDPNAIDCAPLDPSRHRRAIELCNQVDDNCNGLADEEGLQAIQTCHDGVDNDCDGDRDLDCALPLSGQNYQAGTVSGSYLALGPREDNDTYEAVTEKSKVLTKIWTVLGAAPGLNYELRAEAYENADANDTFRFSYLTSTVVCSPTAGTYLPTDLIIDRSVDDDQLQSTRVGSLPGATYRFCLRLGDNLSDTQADTVRLDRVFLFPRPACPDDDFDGYPANCDDCASLRCASLDCDDHDAAVNPGATEGPPGSPTCSDGDDNDCRNGKDADDRSACQPPPPDVVASGEDASGYGSIVSGGSQSTHISDQLFEVLREDAVGTRKSRLVHVWIFDPVPQGSAYDLLLQGQRANNADGDDFQFHFSTDGVSFTAIAGALVNSEVQPSTPVLRRFLPAQYTGKIYIQARDTQENGKSLDFLEVNFLAIRTTP